MNTLNILNEFKDNFCFRGVFPIDKICNLKITKKPFGIIINLDYSNEPGSHWVAIFVNESNEAFYFDSFGFPNLSKELKKFLNLNEIKIIVYNKYFLQSMNSNTCGAYCVLFLKMCCHGYSMYQFLNLFSKNTKTNDLISVMILE